MKFLFITILFFIGLINPTSSYASNIRLEPCVEISHCVLEEWNISDIKDPLAKVKNIIESTPRTKIVEFNGNYIHAEVTSKWMKYIDDLEISYSNKNNIFLIRSESRVGEGDFGVNQNRVNLIKSKLLR